MQAINYKRLNSIANSVTPYRGSLNRFPIGNRKHNTKYFLVGEEDGQRVFNIVHGQRWKSVDITKEEHDALKKEGSNRVREYQNGTEGMAYYKYEVYPNILGVVRPDNTFEFTGESYGQGDRGILSSYGHGWLRTVSRMGGTIWWGRLNGNGDRGAYPIYKGLRVNCETSIPAKPITVVGKKVDRKIGKTLLANYVGFYAVAEVMTKAMDYDVFVKTMAEVMNEHMTKGYNDTHWQEFANKAETLMDTAPLDAAMLYMYAWDVGGMRWNLRRYVDSNLTRYSAYEDTPHTMFLNLKRKLNKEIYKKNASVFKNVEYTNCEMYPPSEWGYTVMVDGVEVKQYD
jgi:hypothetical protein